MKSNYRKLGEFIKLRDKRNTNLITEELLGISIDKEYMPSVANVIGTDLTKYKIIEKNVFACNPMHVGRDEKLPIALYKDDKPAIVSPAYFVFEIIDSNILNEEYLMMWFRRSEFDRNCWFKTDGSVRGGISWNEICELDLPVPGIEKQKSIIQVYKNITDRIILKQQINDNLEVTAALLFDKELQVFDSELVQRPIKSYGEVITGKTPPTSHPEYYGNDIPFIKTPDMHGSAFVTESECWLSKKGADSQSNKYIPEFSLIVACIGANAGEVAITTYRAQTNQQINAVVTNWPCIMYYIMKKYREELRSLGEGSSTMLNINKTSFEEYEIPLPSDDKLLQIEQKLRLFFNQIHNNQLEIDSLKQMQRLLITKLGS